MVRVALVVDTAVAFSLAIAMLGLARSDGLITLPSFDPATRRAVSPFSFYPSPIDRILSVGIIVSAATGLSWLVWQYTAQRNVWATAPGRAPRVSPAWAVGWWLVPVANLWMPLVAIRELRTRSHRGSERPPMGGFVILAAWWVVWVASSVVGLIAVVELLVSVFSRLIQNDGAFATGASFPIHEIADTLRLFALSYALRAIAAGLGFAVIGDIEQAQAKMPVGESAPGSWILVPSRPDIA